MCAAVQSPGTEIVGVKVNADVNVYCDADIAYILKATMVSNSNVWDAMMIRHITTHPSNFDLLTSTLSTQGVAVAPV